MVDSTAQSVKYTLKYPIQLGDEVVSVLTFKRLKTKHLKIIGKIKDDVDKTIETIMQCCGLTEMQVEEIDVSDMKAIGDLLNDFLA